MSTPAVEFNSGLRFRSFYFIFLQRLFNLGTLGKELKIEVLEKQNKTTQT